MELKGWDLRFPQLLCEVGFSHRRFGTAYRSHLNGLFFCSQQPALHDCNPQQPALHDCSPHFPTLCTYNPFEYYISIHVENFQVVSFLHVPPESHTRLSSRLHLSRAVLFHPPWWFTLIIFSKSRSVTFRKFRFLRCGIVSPLFNPQAGGAPLVGRL